MHAGNVYPSDLPLELVHIGCPSLIIPDLRPPVLYCPVVDHLHLCKLIYPCRVLPVHNPGLVSVWYVPFEVLTQERHILSWIYCRLPEFA